MSSLKQELKRLLITCEKWRKEDISEILHKLPVLLSLPQKPFSILQPEESCGLSDLTTALTLKKQKQKQFHGFLTPGSLLPPYPGLWPHWSALDPGVSYFFYLSPSWYVTFPVSNHLSECHAYATSCLGQAPCDVPRHSIVLPRWHLP